MDVLLKILEGVQDGMFFLRASSVHGLNDESEYFYGIKQLRRILPAIERRIQDEGYKIDDNFLISKTFEEEEKRHSYNLNDRFADLMLQGNKVPYIISTSSKGDYIPMWSMYGDSGKGVSIGIDVASLFVETKTDDGILMKLSDEPHALKLVDTLSLNHPAAIVCKREYIDYLEKVKEKSNHVDIKKLMITTFGTMALYTAPLVKHPAFKYENEWRLLAYEQKVGEVNYDFNGKGKLTSFIKVSIPIEKLRKIIIGPCCHRTYQQDIIRKLFQDKGISHCKVSKSKIPLR